MIYIFGRMNCMYTRNTIQLCKHNNIPFSFVNIDKLTKKEHASLEQNKGSKITTVPVIFQKRNYSKYIGGYSEFKKDISKYKYNHTTFNIKDKVFIPRNNITISKYLLFPTRKDLFTIPDISNGEFNYILCPGYEKNEYQIGVTGTCKMNEPLRDALTREVNEEVGMRLKDNVKYKTYIDSKCNRKIAHGVYHIHSFTPQKNREDIEEEDDKSQKISAILYGNMNNLKQMILDTSRKGGLDCCIDDNIFNIGIISVKYLKNTLSMQNRK